MDDLKLTEIEEALADAVGVGDHKRLEALVEEMTPDQLVELSGRTGISEEELRTWPAASRELSAFLENVHPAGEA